MNERKNMLYPSCPAPFYQRCLAKGVFLPLPPYFLRFAEQLLFYIQSILFIVHYISDTKYITYPLKFSWLIQSQVESIGTKEISAS